MATAESEIPSAMCSLRSAALAAALSAVFLWQHPALAQAQPVSSGFDPAVFCNDSNIQSAMRPAAIKWGHDVGETAIVGGYGFRVSDVRVASFEKGETVVCRVTLSFTLTREGREIKLAVNNADFLIYGNDDGSTTFVTTHKWPTAEELKQADNRYNRNLVINGETLQQARDKRREAQPGSVIEAMGALQQSYNQQAEAELRRQGMGPMLDQEEARRARLTPAQRAAEDAWNRGAAPGETICINVAGVRRCKTG